MMDAYQHDRNVRWFVWVFLGTLVIKSLLAIYFPLTGDEAYFAIWGKFFHWGYYDHTPLIGWLLYPFVHLSTSNFVLRLPTILITSVIGLLIYYFVKHYDREKAALIAILYLISPINLCGVLITTDVPLIFFSFLSGLCLVLALRKNDHLLYYFLSGVSLGLAFFSKYFAVLLALSYLIFFIVTPKTKKRTLGFLILFLCVLPFGLENLYWNYTHDWANIVFNLFTRNRGDGVQWQTVILYCLIIVYIVTPPIFYYACKHWKKLWRKPEYPELVILMFSVFVPFIFFFLLSFIKSIGLHWPLSFVPFLYLLTLIYFSRNELVRSIKFMVGFTLLHLILIVTVMLMPVQCFQHFGVKGAHYTNLVFNLKHQEVSNILKQYDSKFIIASDSYAKINLFYLDTGVYGPTFGHGSVHGREGDFLTNFKLYQNKNFVILVVKKPDLAIYAPYFKVVRTQKLLVKGATFYLIFGYKFNYPVYRDTILKRIDQRYWQVPRFLPYSGDFYYKKYFSQPAK